MALELIVNLLFLGFSIFCFFYVGATMPVSPVDELGAEQWPQGLLTILIIALCWNIYKYFKRNGVEAIKKSLIEFIPGVMTFVKSKLFVGMLLVMGMALIYEPLGFMVTSLAFLISYGILLGERRPLILILSAIIITVLLYVGFAVFLGVMLPRGQVPFLRNFALFIESIIPTF
ncbi:MAG: tripartite tricarboxylate transporter TctB family protein [Angelakisella sp.]|nr:tripartite tricarboxylate transporter TctB family protein [Angelakisella sp.]